MICHARKRECVLALQIFAAVDSFKGKKKTKKNTIVCKSRRTEVRKKDSMETSYEISARILVFGAPQDLLNYLLLSFNAYPPSALRISISPSLPGAFAGILRVLKEQDIPGQFFPFLFTERENVLRWKKSDEKLCTERGT